MAAIDSVLKQTYANYEIVFVDDGSTDGTSDVLRQFQVERCIGGEEFCHFYQPNQVQSVESQQRNNRSQGRLDCLFMG
jgi:glycosyltransferase involved in cell wall biosynthesis